MTKRVEIDRRRGGRPPAVPPEDYDLRDLVWAKAACAGMDSEIFLGGDEDRIRWYAWNREYGHICEGCPVRRECFDWGMLSDPHTTPGVWGGTSKAQRARIFRWHGNAYPLADGRVLWWSGKQWRLDAPTIFTDHTGREAPKPQRFDWEGGQNPPGHPYRDGRRAPSQATTTKKAANLAILLGMLEDGKARNVRTLKIKDRSRETVRDLTVAAEAEGFIVRSVAEGPTGGPSGGGQNRLEATITPAGRTWLADYRARQGILPSTEEEAQT